MELNNFQIVGALIQPPRRATTQSGTELLELVLENQASDGYNGMPPKTEVISISLTGDFRQYESLRQGQVILVAGKISGQMASSANGQQYCKIRLRQQSVTVLPYQRQVTVLQQPQDGGYGQQQQRQSPYGGGFGV